MSMGEVEWNTPFGMASTMWPKSDDALAVESRPKWNFDTMSRVKISSSGRAKVATGWKWFMVEGKLVIMRNVATQALGMLLERLGMEAGHAA
jgi:hypothetical protein